MKINIEKTLKAISDLDTRLSKQITNLSTQLMASIELVQQLQSEIVSLKNLIVAERTEVAAALGALNETIVALEVVVADLNTKIEDPAVAEGLSAAIAEVVAAKAEIESIYVAAPVVE